MAPFRTPRKVRNSRRNMPYPTPSSRYSLRRTGTSTGTSRRSLASKVGHESVVTRQHDFSKQYRYKKMPRFKKRAWRKFSKKVVAVQLKQAGLKTVVFNSKLQLTTDPGYQNVFNVGLYGINGALDATGNAGFSDMYRIFKNDPDIVKAAGEPKAGKLQFGSAVLDLTIRNFSADIEAEVDVYYGWFKKDDDSSKLKANTYPLYVYQNAPQDLIDAGLTQTSLFFRGCTLFDKPQGISATGYHITKKMKLLLAPGQTSFLQHRDAKNYMLDWTNVQDVGYAKRGLTFGMWIVFKPSVAASEEATVTLGVGVTRKYSYAKVEDNVDRIAYNPPA